MGEVQLILTKSSHTTTFTLVSLLGILIEMAEQIMRRHPIQHPSPADVYSM